MDVRHLELLRDLSVRGSVTAVARATHRTPSAVSQQLRTAQREFGTQLVEPAGRGLRLTPAGELLAQCGHDVARVVAQVQARWDAFRGQPSGTVSVAGLPSAATYLLPKALGALDETGIDLVFTDVDVAERAFADLVTEHDIVIAHSLTSHAPAGTEGLVTVELVREPLDVAMAANHALAARDDVRPEDLVDQEWIGVPIGFPFDVVRLAVEEATGQQVRVVQRMRDNRLIEALVVASDKVAILPRFTSPQGKDVVLRPLRGISTARHIFAVMRPDRAERLAVQTVVGALEEAVPAAT
ncbi:DNA-binding transcriptional LysR family regulator [Nocardioides daedukensis]|uniref:DNA-binding transcriptional LysR family regulator n=1 Tax=Nocardioides daedukensis TaxID=634462 RepID=A0A7Y9UNF5_9ACTN|nr:LysR family transcriptional regulator [Nocardioides daedukensis]NYG58498.1 DNA-binding transcriptional LysR family regulator [Nocardioides daedukensis]